MSESEDDAEACFLTFMTGILPTVIEQYARTPCRTSVLTGHSYYTELIETDSINRFQEVARMDREVFLKLKDVLVDTGLLSASKHMCCGEKLMIFLYTITGNSNRASQERWQHSGETINRTVHEVARAVLCIKDTIIRPPLPNVPDEIQSNPKFWPFFKDCMGALDGTHIPAVVPAAATARFRNRKGFLSQNVLGVCGFDMQFLYVLAGWEGSAHDGRVLLDALGKGFPRMPGKYYLGDAGYSLTSYCITPYRGVRYHLNEWQRGNQRPQNKKELFNLRHASLRNVIERVFGVLKKRFPLLTSMSSFPFPFQADLVLCILTIHNFIKNEQALEDNFDGINIDIEDNDVNADVIEQFEEDNMDMATKRDEIATEMWEQYQQFIEINNL